MKIPRIMIAAPRSGSGKTLITCGLLGALKRQNKNVMAFKCGPDYIDPMFHRSVQQIDTENLDTFFTGERKTRQIFAQAAYKHDIAVIEGVMGLFDGLGGIREEGSAYHLAKVTDTPIILVVDVHGMGKSMIPFIRGFEQYDEAGLIKGIILNRITASFYETMKGTLKEELDTPVIGYFPDKKEINLKSRYLGLIMPKEIENIHKQLNMAAEQIEESVDIKSLLKIAEDAGDIKEEQIEEKHCVEKSSDSVESDATERDGTEIDGSGLTIAVARDRAFCFYYEANIREFKKRGVEIKYFSPLDDATVPDGIDALLLGGGYPELYGEKLSSNETMRESIKKAVDGGIPLLAECGGFMYLHKSVTDADGCSWPMVGAIDAQVEYKGKLVRFGYVDIEEKNSRFLCKGQKIKAHEFHYFDSTDNGGDCIAIKPTTGKKWNCIHATDHSFVGFPHLYYPSAPEFVSNFVLSMRYYHRDKNKGC
ncbi:MAG: cobyrinate a,c-diamide synthase [Lachnospiraceae bacterium]|nr:cobyrinate a,c-diamide synthase [Lachnospiraceae bacterium]